MTKIKVLDTTGKVGKTIEVSSDIFDVKANPQLLSQAIKAARANRRQAIAHTKNRGEVSGGGKKPFRQKGTGNARAGSIRSPLWRGGGVTFGPRNNRNFSKKLTAKMGSKALKMALGEKLRNQKLIVVGKLRVDEISTNKMQAFLEKLPIEEGKILFVLAKTNINLELSMANLSYLKTVLPSGLNLIDLINADYLVTDEEGLKLIESNFEGKK